MVCGAWYLVVYGWMGATFTATAPGSIGWVGAAILSIVATEPMARWTTRREEAATQPAPPPAYVGPTGV